MAICRDNLNYSTPQLNPFDPNSILNPNFEPDPGCIDPAISILIYVGDTPVQFNCFYTDASLEVEENFGFERGKASFKITDYDPNMFNLPFIPLADMRIEVWNLSENDIIFSGKIAEVKPFLIRRRCDGTEVTYFEIVCYDKKIDLERIYVNERYTNVTTGFVLRDVIRRFSFFDETEIDPSMGTILEDYRVSWKYTGQVIQEILDYETNWTFWYDPETNKVYIGPVEETYNTIMYVTEDNVYDYFDAPSFFLSPDTSLIRDRIYFRYNQKYNQGTVSIAQGDTILFGQGTEFLANVTSGSELRINGDDAVYSVSKVIDDVTIRLSNEFQDTTIVTGVPYQVTGSKGLIVASDQNTINLYAAINNETGQYAGVYEYLVPDDPNSYTREEAMQIAKSNLLGYIEPILTGEGKSNSVKIPLRALRAGQIINFNLPISKRIVADIKIQRLVKRDTGAILCRMDQDPTDDRIDPLLLYDFDFKDRMFDTRNQIKRLMSDVRKLRADDDDIIENVNIVGETIYIDDCVELVPPIEIIDGVEIYDSIAFLASFLIDDELQISDAIAITTPPAGPYFTTPTGRQSGYVIGRNRFGFAS